MREIEVIQKTGIIQLNDRTSYRVVTKAEFNQKLLSTDEIQLSVESKMPITFYLGDVIYHQERYFTLNIAPTIKRENGCYIYDLIFEGVQYTLRKKIYFNFDKLGVQTTSEFPLTGEIDIFLKVLINNLNSLNEGEWILGEYPKNTETKTITFNNDNCLSVLQKICEEYQMEFEFVENYKNKKYQLNIKKIGRVLSDTFEYGYGNGLYSLQRTNENNDVVTKLYVFGSSENIPHDYRGYSDRLRMPISQGDFIMDKNKVQIFGLKEGVKTLDIKPTFKGIISKVGVFDKKTKTQELQVNNMDFDLNEVDDKGNTKYLISETPVKLNILKGNLAGYSFELIRKEGYNHQTKTFKIKQFIDIEVRLSLM